MCNGVLRRIKKNNQNGESNNFARVRARARLLTEGRVIYFFLFPASDTSVPQPFMQIATVYGMC